MATSDLSEAGRAAGSAFRVDIAGEYGNPDGSIHLMDGEHELVMWDSAEWAGDPSLLYVIANAIRIGYTEGPDGIRDRLATGVLHQAQTLRGPAS